MTSPDTLRHADTPMQRLLVIIPVILLFGLLLWDVRLAMQPLVVFPLLIFALWPARQSDTGRHAIALATIVFGIWFVLHLQSVLLPFVLAFAIAYLLAPLVNEVQQRGVPRALAALMVLVPFLGIIVLLLVLLVPQIQHQVFELVGRLPEFGNRVANWILQLRQRVLLGGAANWLTDEQLDRLRGLQASDLVSLVSARWDAVANNLWQALLGIGKGVGAGLGIVLAILGYIVVAPVVAFYLLLSWPVMIAKSEELLPPAWRPGVVGFVQEYDVALGRFVRGQLIEAVLVAVLTTLALWVLGFPAAVLMGVIAGLGNLIPNLGLFLSIIPGLFVALTAPDIGSALLKLIGVFAVVQFIDSSITGPRIVGGSVGLNPVWVMLAVLVFGQLFGIMGMFLAVPIAVFLKMALMRAIGRYRTSGVYNRPVETP